MPHDAIIMLDQIMKERADKVFMVAICGPGDPLAVPDTSIKTIRLVRSRYPQMRIGLKTLGIGSERFAAALAEAGVHYVEMEVNGVKPEILEKIYAWIRPGQKTLKISEAARLMVSEQKNGVSALTFNNITVSITTTFFPGYNGEHIGHIARSMRELGADSMSVIPYEPDPEAEVMLASPDPEMVKQATETVASLLKYVEPLLSATACKDSLSNQTGEKSLPKPTKERPNVAVASASGMNVDLHLGHARRVLIYGPREGGLVCLLETRKTPDGGAGSKRWFSLAETLPDCFAILVAQAGETVRTILSESGITILITDEYIEEFLDVLYCGGKKKKRING